MGLVKKTMSLCIVWLLLLTIISFAVGENNVIEKELENASNMIFDSANNTFYVVGRKYAYTLDDSLELITNHTINNSDSGAKILILAGNNIIACDSQANGACQNLSLNKESQPDPDDRVAVKYVPQFGTSIVAFIVADSIYLAGTVKNATIMNNTELQNIQIITARNISTIETLRNIPTFTSDKDKAVFAENYFPKAAVTNNNQSYIIANQLYNDGEQNISIAKITRVSQYDSTCYTDMVLQCGDVAPENQTLTQAAIIRSVNDTRIIVATIFRDKHDPSSSYLCLYNMTKIADHIADHIKPTRRLELCNATANYTYKTNVPAEKPSISNQCLCKICCEKYEYVDNCGKCSTTTNLKEVPLRESSKIGYITAVTGIIINGGTLILLYFGQENGNVYRTFIDVSSSECLRPTQITKFNMGKDILQIKFLVSTSELVVLSQKKISKLNEASCGNNSYFNCLSDEAGALCGWCIEEKRCTIWSNCSNNDYWLPSIKNKPTQGQSIHSDSKVNISINNFPINSTRDNLTCNFTDVDITMVKVEQNANIWNLICDIPFIKDLGFRQLQMYIYSEYYKIPVVYLKLDLFNCSALTKASECMEPNRLMTTFCYWCICDGKCVNKSSNCENEESVLLKRYVKRAKFSITGSAVTRDLNVSCQDKIDYNCTLDTSSSVKDNQTIVCDAYEFKASGNKTVILTLNKILKKDAQIEVFDICSTILNCSICSYLKKQYGCNWCGNTCIRNSCTPDNTCDKKTNFENIEASEIPFNKGPHSGGTHIAIKGNNFSVVSIKTVSVIIGGMFNCEIFNITSELIECITSRGKGRDLQLTLWYYRLIPIELNKTFSFLPDPTVKGIIPNRTFASGGANLTVFGTGFDAIQRPEIGIATKQASFIPCYQHKRNDTHIVCPAPSIHDLVVGPSIKEDDNGIHDLVVGPSIKEDDNGIHDLVVGPSIKEEDNGIHDLAVGPSIKEDDNNTTKIRNKRMASVTSEESVTMKMDGVVQSIPISYGEDPEFIEFEEESRVRRFAHHESGFIVIQGKRLNETARITDYTVSVGVEACLVVTSPFLATEIRCYPPKYQPNKTKKSSKYPEVKARVGFYEKSIGYLQYAVDDDSSHLVIIISVLVVVMILIVIGSFILVKYKAKQNSKAMKAAVEKTELEMVEQCREVFNELQTDMTDITEKLVDLGIPFNGFFSYIFQIIFPQYPINQRDDHIILNPLKDHEGSEEECAAAMNKLDQLVNNKFFLISFIRTVDHQTRLKSTERSNLAGYISFLLINNMEYFTEVIEVLIRKLLTDDVKQKSFNLLFTRCETLTEKLVIHWMSICSYNSIKRRSGSSLFMLYQAIESLCIKWPVDAVTLKTHATLCQDHLLTTNIESKQLNLKVKINNGICVADCQVLDCDSITQVKNKCINAAYKRECSYDKPVAEDVDLEWQIESGSKILYDEDISSIVENGYRKLNTPSHYGLTDGCTVFLLSKEIEGDYVNCGQLISTDREVMTQSEDTESTERAEPEKIEQLPTFHLIPPSSKTGCKKSFLELNFNRLLRTKVNLKKYIDDVIHSVVNIHDIPVAVRHLFQLLETTGCQESVDRNVIESWKKNSYYLKLWSRLLSQPGVLLDLSKSSKPHIQANMNVIVLAFIDSFSQPQTLSKNSPSQKVLFYKDCSEYRHTIQTFFQSVNTFKGVTPEDLAAELSKLPYLVESLPINRHSTLYQLFSVIDTYYDQINTDLDKMEESVKLKLSEKLDDVFETMRNS